jgi:hypothetical protein
MSRRFPSMSKRWKDQPLVTAAKPSIRSAPASRASSLRLSGMKHAFGTHSESRTPPFTPVESVYREPSSTRTSRIPSAPIDIQRLDVEDPISHRDFASTPLLPPMMESNMESRRSQVHSPLQSPTIAESDGTFTPRMTPNLAGMPTPPLSTKASIASFRRLGADQCASTSDIPTMPLSDDNDPWAARLGHANFHITPEPYFPDHCDVASCKRLLDDWEAARNTHQRALWSNISHLQAYRTQVGRDRCYVASEPRACKCTSRWFRAKPSIPIVGRDSAFAQDAGVERRSEIRPIPQDRRLRNRRPDGPVCPDPTPAVATSKLLAVVH